MRLATTTLQVKGTEIVQNDMIKHILIKHTDMHTIGNSPFALHDLNSRSAILGVPGKGSKSHLYWMKKNPNEGTRKTGNRKKKSGV